MFGGRAQGMAVGTGWRANDETFSYPGLNLSARPQRLLAGAALICIAFACSWTMCVNLMGDPADQIADTSATRTDKLVTFIDRFEISRRGNKLTVDARNTPP